MKKIFWNDHNGVLADIIPNFETARYIKDADVMLLWQDVLQDGAALARAAHAYGKKVVVVQHGRNATVDYCPPHNYKLEADKICVWGQTDADRLLKAGIPKKKIEITGTTILDHKKPKQKHDGINVVFRPAHWDVPYLQENIDLMNKIRSIKGINVFTKITEYHNAEDYDNVVFSNRDMPGHVDTCFDLLSKADIVVGNAEDGTFEMMAYAMDIPVIIVDIWESKSFLHRDIVDLVITEACEKVSMEDFEKVFWETIEHPEKKKEERLRVSLNEGGVGLPGKPMDKIIKVINDI